MLSFLSAILYEFVLMLAHSAHYGIYVFADAYVYMGTVAVSLVIGIAWWPLFARLGRRSSPIRVATTAGITSGAAIVCLTPLYAALGAYSAVTAGTVTLIFYWWRDGSRSADWALPMMSLNPKVKLGLKTFVLLALLLLLSVWSCVGFQLGVWGPAGYRGYKECIGMDPVGSDLWSGRVKPGDSISDLITRRNPFIVSRFGKWTDVEFWPAWGRSCIMTGFYAGPRISILAKSDSIVQADFHYRGFYREFFSRLSDSGKAERDRDWADYMRGP